MQALKNFFQSNVGGTAAGFFIPGAPYQIGTDTLDAASEVPEGKGWRKALCDFTGDDTTITFYNAFREFAYAMKDDGTVPAQILLR